MKKNYFETVLGFLIIFFAIFFLINFFKVNSSNYVSDHYKLSANFIKTGGIVIGNDVKLSGVKVGTVVDVQLNSDYFAVVDFYVKKKIILPHDSSISVKNEGLLGNKYLSISPGSNQEKMLKPNDEIKKVLDFESIEDQVSKIIFLATQ